MKNYQKEALRIAKKSILEEFGKADLSGFTPKSKKLYKIKSCFVTLKTKGTDLRGCIGTLEPSRELYLDIISNSKSACFNDSRFNSLTFEELKNLYLEITILSPTSKVIFNTINEFLDYLSSKHPGLVIELGIKRATFLPSVWKELPNTDYFLQHLLFKAGISFDEFVENFNKVNIEVYFGIEFGDYFKNI